MKVAVIQAIPNRAMADIMPALNTAWSGTVFTDGLAEEQDHDADHEHHHDDGARHVERHGSSALDVEGGAQVLGHSAG